MSKPRLPCALTALSLAAGSLALIAPARAQSLPDTGWYANFGLSYDQLRDSRGQAVVQVQTTEMQGCVLGNLNGIGGVLTGLIGSIPGLADVLVQDGCVLELIGPGTEITGTEERIVPTTIRFKGGLGAQGAFGYGFGSGIRAELALHYARNDFDRISFRNDAGMTVSEASSNRFEGLGAFANLWWDFLDRPKVRPYLGGGIGFNNVRLTGDGPSRSDSGAAYQLGAGVAFPLSDYWQLSADYRYLVQTGLSFGDAGSRLEADYKRQSLMLSGRYFFGGTARGPAAVAAALAAEEAARRGRDDEPSFAGPAVVATEPDESELDRFLKGQGENETFVLRGVQFEFDSDRLLPESILILNEVAESLKRFPDVVVDVEGHTCIIGTPAYNLGLSERRANAVKRYLQSRGVDVSRMNAVGYGQSRPIADNSTEEGRQQNRRVEFRAIRGG